MGERTAGGVRRRRGGALVAGVLALAVLCAAGLYVRARGDGLVLTRLGHSGRAGRDTGLDADLAAAVGGLAPDGAGVSVAVLDTATGEGGSYGGESDYDTASVVRVDILAALLLRAQDARRGLTAQESGYATAMVARDDGGATTALWHGIGGAAGLDAANARFGLTATRSAAGGLWQLTRTTAADQLALLRVVFGENSVLTAGSQRCARGLLARRNADERWGVPAAADSPSASTADSGRLQRPSTRRWDVDSIGEVRSAGHNLLIAVLSSGNASAQAGVTLVENAAREAAQTVLTG